MRRLKKKMYTMIILAVSVLLIIPLAGAQGPGQLTAWTDRPEYGPGESGTLSFTFLNLMGRTIAIKKITILFTHWQAYKNGQWEGNQTIEVNSALVVDQLYQNSTKFTVPTDGRATTTWLEITIQTDEFGDLTYRYPDTPIIPVILTPRYMEQIVTLLTIQEVLIIVCTIIIAATVFLSSRKPKPVWKTEEQG